MRKPLREQGGCRWPAGEGGDRFCSVPGFERDSELGELLARDEVIGKAESDRVGTRHRAGGESEVSAELAGRARQQEGAADIRNEADSGLRHSQPGAFCHDPHGAVGGDADPTAEHHTVHEGHIGLREAGDVRVERVFIRPEPGGAITAAL